MFDVELGVGVADIEMKISEAVDETILVGESVHLLTD